MTKKALVAGLFCSVVSLSTLNATIELSKLEGSYRGFKKEYQHCSPWWGAVWWHGRLIENLYRFGGDYPQLKGLSRITKKLFHELEYNKDNVTPRMVYEILRENKDVISKNQN